MPRIVVPDTSCLIALETLDLVDLILKLYPESAVPAAVAMEYGEDLPTGMIHVAVQNVLLVQALRSTLGPGEAEVIALTVELTDAMCVLDDERARRVARQFNVIHTGTLGLLLKAKSAGLLPSLANALTLLERSGFRVSAALKQDALHRAGEA